MNYKLIYFSPTGTTQKITKLIINNLSKEIIEFDITTKSERKDSLIFGEDDIAVIGIPVYSGRVPMVAQERISAIRGNKTPAVLISTYGNRHYDDSLLELKTIMQSNGFLVVAAAAFVTEHSVVQKFGKGRPNSEDIKVIHEFAEMVKNKINLWREDTHTDLFIKGNSAYREYKTIPIKPHTNSSCTKCGLCAKKCPTQAIPVDSPQKTIKQLCITCMRCIRICPQHARNFTFIEKFLAEKSLSKLCKDYKQPEIFI